MQNTPDHLTLLHLYKRAGVEPIKLAKSVFVSVPPSSPRLLTTPQRTRHIPPNRHISPRPANPRVPLRHPFAAQRASRVSSSPPPHRPLRRPRLRSPITFLLGPPSPPVRRLCRACRLLHGPPLPGPRSPTPHNRALDSSAFEFYFQEIPGEF
jgi:hypothetical protein